MGLPAKVLAEGERPLVVLRPHALRLIRPAVVLLLLAPTAAVAVAAVPVGPARLPTRAVVAGVALVVALRWVVLPFLLWWNTLYVLTDERVVERQGVVRRSGHDLPLRAVTDVVVAQRLGERLLGCGTLTVTTDGGAELEVGAVPAVHRVRRSLLVVADDIAERLRIHEERWQADGWGHDVAGDDGLGDDGLGDDGPGDGSPPGFGGASGRGRSGDGSADGWGDGSADGWGDGWGEGWDDDGSDDDGWDGAARAEWDDDEPGTGGPSRREARRRARETTRRLKALQTEVRKASRPDSPVEDDRPARRDADPDAGPGPGPAGEGARILRFPGRP
ncbi:MAG TPA: PH domain-containing protein [Kineosporiaceae bacterium]|nr:PH domain-containing protein [Kineosporiaceae bacterium]